MKNIKGLKSKCVSNSVIFFFVFFSLSVRNIYSLNKKASFVNKNILFISSYDPTFPTYFIQVNGLRQEFSKNHIRLETMSMNKKRDFSKKGDSIFIEQLKYRMSLKPKISGVVVGDDDAFHFALDEQNDIFKDIPIVFLGVNNKELAYKQDENKKITGVVEDISINETIDLIFQLLPKTKRVIAISDKTKSGRADLKTFFDVTNTRSDSKFDSINLSNISFAEFKKKLSYLDKEDVLLLLSCFVDKNDSVISFDRGVSFLNDYSPVPVFHLWGHGVGTGLLGGYVVSQISQGEWAAKLLMQKMKNPQDKVLVKRNSPNRIILDNNVLKKFNISLKNIPKGSNVEILNKKDNILKRYRTVFVSLAIIIFVLIVIISFLLYSSYKNKQLRQLLKEKKDAAERSNNLKSSFLANMSHEIRTPLNAIVGFSKLIIDEDLEDGEKKAYSEIISNNNELLLKLINDILDLSKLDAGFVSMEYKVIDIISLIKNICFSLQRSASLRNNELVFVTDLKYMEIEYDSNKFRQVLNNLLTNAIKFTENGKIEVFFQDLDNYVKISVSDNGIGIPLDKQKNVFKRFAKLNTYTQGTGLGLSLCKSIIESSGGKIYFCSKPNKGSCFSIEIPKKKINLF